MWGLIIALIFFFGGCASIAFLVRLGRLIWQLIRPSKKLSSFGEWTVITGATSGIGKAMAFELARKGQNVLVIGRNPKKLGDLIAELKEAYPSRIQFEALQMDLSNISEEDQSRYTRAIAKKDVGILINNAGLAYKYTMYFDEVPTSHVSNMIGVNTRSPTILTHLTLPKMLSKRKGAVINISSAGAITPHELHCVYSGTKSYLLKWTMDLALEYDRKGVMFQCQMPYFVVSPMSKIRRSSLMIPTAHAYARSAIAQIGYSGFLSPYPMHALLFFVLNMLPWVFLEKYVGPMHHRIRKKGLKKYGAKQK